MARVNYSESSKKAELKGKKMQWGSITEQVSVVLSHIYQPPQIAEMLQHSLKDVSDAIDRAQSEWKRKNISFQERSLYSLVSAPSLVKMGYADFQRKFNGLLVPYVKRRGESYACGATVLRLGLLVCQDTQVLAVDLGEMIATYTSRELGHLETYVSTLGTKEDAKVIVPGK